MNAWIMLAVSCSAFIALGTYVLVRHLVGRKLWLWPDDEHVIGRHGNMRAHLFARSALSGGLRQSEVADLCALAATCVGELGITEICVHVLDDARYDKECSKKSNGELRTLKTRSGNKSMPLIMCRTSKFSSTLSTGSLIIHELVHYAYALKHTKHDYNHVDPQWWLPTITSLEAQSQARFVNAKIAAIRATRSQKIL